MHVIKKRKVLIHFVAVDKGSFHGKGWVPCFRKSFRIRAKEVSLPVSRVDVSWWLIYTTKVKRIFIEDASVNSE
jgi:hypothetical protein